MIPWDREVHASLEEGHSTWVDLRDIAARVLKDGFSVGLVDSLFRIPESARHRASNIDIKLVNNLPNFSPDRLPVPLLYFSPNIVQLIFSSEVLYTNLPRGAYTMAAVTLGAVLNRHRHPPQRIKAVWNPGVNRY